MKTFPSTNQPIRRQVRKKRASKPLPIEIHRIAHSLFNQLSIITLCNFKLSASLRNTVDPGISDDLEKLQRAVQEAAIIAEQLAETIAEAELLGEPKMPEVIRSEPQANNVLPFRAGRQ
jgi:hypothetical protein